jgi:hypothetical protein
LKIGIKRKEKIIKTGLRYPNLPIKKKVGLDGIELLEKKIH